VSETTPICGTEEAHRRHRRLREDCDTCLTSHYGRVNSHRAARASAAKLRRQNTEASRADLLVPVDRDEDDWRMEVYSARGLNTAKERKQPRRGDQRRILAVQGNVCLYCAIPIGTVIARQMHRSTGYIWTTTVTLQRNWDHFVPFAFLIQNPDTNWVLACHVCNRAKRNQMFETVNDARRVILPIREQRGYESPRRVLMRLASG
jgi:hypothetical protein